MTTINSKNLVARFRRAGPPALLAACLAVGPAYAQSTTVIQQDEPSTTQTKIKEKPNGDVVVKQKESDDGDTVKSKTVIKDREPSTTTTTTVR